MKFLNGVDASNQKVIGVADPTNPTDAVNLQYLQNFVAGLDVKQGVRAASTANLNLASPGASIDGVSLSTGDRFLAKNQTAGAENGVYVWNGAASAATRASDANSSAKVTAGMFIPNVAEGTVNADTAWVLTTNDTITLGTTALTFTAFSSGGTTYVAGAGLTLSGSTFDVVAADGSITVGADNITVGNVPISKGGTGQTTAAAARTALGAVGKYAATITTVAATPLTVTHNLGTQDLTVTLWSAASAGEQVFVDITQTDNNSLTVTTAGAQSNMRIVITG